MKLNFEFPRGNFPRLILAGNSNVGKSSITKTILSHPDQYKGKVGKFPGSTVRLTLINDPSLPFHVIDLPGLGKMLHRSRTEEAEIQRKTLDYIEADASNIFLAILVISAERIGDELEKWYFDHKETIPLSIEFIQYLTSFHIPVVAVLNKIDKLSVYQKKDALEKFQQVLKDFQIPIAGPDAPDGLLAIMPTSVKYGTGMKEFHAIVNKRAALLDLNKFDPRDNYRAFPVITRQTTETHQKRVEFSDENELNDSEYEVHEPEESDESSEDEQQVSKKIDLIIKKGPKKITASKARAGGSYFNKKINQVNRKSHRKPSNRKQKGH
jgi:GTP-binding protein EngB required for normal cell division